MGLVKDMLSLLVIFWMQVVIWVRGSSLPERHVQVLFLMSFRILGTQRRGDEKIAPPFLRRSGRLGGRASQSFSSPWGWVNFCTWGCLEIALGGNRRRGFFRLVSPAEGVSALALTLFKLAACVRADGQTPPRYILSAPPQPPQPPQPPHKRFHPSVAVL